MNFIKRHWFGTLISVIIVFYAVVFVLVLSSPRVDAQKRGFIPCTEQMATDIMSCDDKVSLCMLDAIINNSLCDIKVIGTGLKNWLTGAQETPWCNYIFVPETLSPEIADDEELQEFYNDNPNLIQDMEKIKELNKELENEQFDATEVEPK